MTTIPTQLRATSGSGWAVTQRRLLRAAAVAAVAGIGTAEVYYALVKAAGVPMRAGFLGASHPSPVTAASFATGVLVCTFWGTVIAATVERVSKRASHTFVVIVSVLTALSLLVPIGAGATAVSTKATLVVAHVLIAGMVIPILARVLRKTATA